MFADLIDRALILDTLEGSTKDEVLMEAVDALVADKRLSRKLRGDVLERLGEREKLGSTGIGSGVALPHVKLAEVRQFALVVGRSPHGVAWNAIDGRPVHSLFLLLAPPDRPEDHLAVLKGLSALARNADFRNFFMQAASADVIRDLLREMSGDG